MFNHKLPQAEFPMQTLRKKTSPCKYKNEPSRFLGEGVSFKAKLIGILEVAEARGDRMCQEALADLKMAIRAAGEHKQRISVHVAIDGLRLRDEKTGDSLYHHPVHKISFIAQDMSDSRAFGYIFGSPDTGHRFFGIKTDKAASQVVIAMRDLFQVVFELKKKEIELAKQQLEGKTVTSSSRYISSATIDSSKSQNGDGSILSLRSRLAGSVSGAVPSSSTGAVGGSTSSMECRRVSTSGGAVAELVDLEQELSSLQRGLHQMERLTPPSDPFGDSFTATPGFLPPPPSSARGPRTTASLTSDGGSPFSPPPARAHFNFEAPSTQSSASISLSNANVAPCNNNTTSSLPVAPPVSSAVPQSPVAKHHSPRRSAPAPMERGSAERSSLDKASLGVLERSATASPPITDTHQETSSGGSTIFDVFTDLDPLGTGRSKPYVDKKHFFQELKNPPKKVLKDLVGGISVSASTDSSFQSTFEQPPPKTDLLTTLTSVGRHSGGSVSIVTVSKSHVSNQMLVTSLFTSDPFAETDPFDNTDPFAESLRDDPFNGAPIDFSTRSFQSDYPSATKLLGIGKETTLPETRIGLEEPVKIKFPVTLQTEPATPLQVSLPPETSSRSPRSSKESSSDTKSTVRQRPHSGKVQPRDNQTQPQLRHTVPSPSPPPPLPPKKPIERVSVDSSSSGPPLPLPARRRPGARYSHAAMNWQPTEDDYLTPAPQVSRRPAPSPAPSPSPGLDITLAQLLTCGMDELAGRLRMPAERLSKMTVAQLTSRLRDYLKTGDPPESEMETTPAPVIAPRPSDEPSEFVANFEDNFTTAESSSGVGFVADFDGFNNETERSTYDRYAVFREIEAEGFKSPLPDDTLNQNIEELDSLGSQPELPCDPAPVRSFGGLTFQPASLTLTKPTQPSLQNSKLEELKNVISNIHKTSLSPTPDIDVTAAADTTANGREKRIAESNSDRYAALRDLSAANDSPRPLSADLPDDLDTGAPLKVPKERKKSDEKSDGFDHSDFFDCIDHSLSLTNPDEAFRKSPMITKEMLSGKIIDPIRRSPTKLSAPPPLVSGSVSDIASGSSPEIILTGGRESREDDRDSHDGVHLNNRRGDAAWALLGGPNPPGVMALVRAGGAGVDSNVAMQSEDGASPWSSDSKDSPPPPLPQPKARQRNYADGSSQRRHRRNPKSWQTRQTSSSSRDVSPWEEDPPPRDAVPHTRSYHRERHESIGSCERRDSIGSRERRDSGSGRDRERTHERDRHRRRHHSRDDDDEWSEERGYGGSRRLSPCSGRLGSRENRRERAWPSEERWRSDDRGYSTVGRREGSRRRGEPPWQAEDPVNRYSSTMGGRAWRRSGGSGGESDRRSRHVPAPSQHRARPANSSRTSSRQQLPTRRSPFGDSPSPSPAASPPRSRRHRFFDDFDRVETDSPAAKNGARFRFSNDFSERESAGSRGSPFDDDFAETPVPLMSKNIEVPEKIMDKTSPSAAIRPPDFARFEPEQVPADDDLSASPASPRPRPTPTLFEDDFSPEPRNGIQRSGEAEVIPEEDPHDLQEERPERTVGFRLGAGAPERRRSQRTSSAKARPRPDPDIKKSESVNIFARESDPFDGDDFFSRSAADRDSRRGDFAAFDNL